MVGTFINLVSSMVGTTNLGEAAADMIPVFLDAFARNVKGNLVKIVNLTCPGCGARLEVDMDRKMAFCSYCGAALPVDDEIQKVQLDGAEKAGYEFEKGRQRAQAEAA